MANIENIKAILTWDEHKVGMEIKDGDETVTWEKLDRDVQVRILNGMASMYGLFYKNLKEA